MVEINLFLHDITEITMFTDFARTLDAYREKKYAPENWVDVAASCGPVQFVGIGAPPNCPPIVSRDDHAPCPTPEPTREVLDRPVPDVAPVTVAKLASSVVMQAQLEEALKAYGRAKGFPAARTLLDEYTKGKLGDVPAEKRAELYARLTA